MRVDKWEEQKRAPKGVSIGGQWISEAEQIASKLARMKPKDFDNDSKIELREKKQKLVKAYVIKHGGAPHLVEDWHHAWSESSTSEGAAEIRHTAILMMSRSKEEVAAHVKKEEKAFEAVGEGNAWRYTMGKMAAGQVERAQRRVATLAAMAKVSQAMYAGERTVTLYRGVSNDQANEIRRQLMAGDGQKEPEIRVGLGALSSWSEKREAAQVFADQDDNGIVITCKVPVKAIAVSHRALGSSDEQEVVVFSHGTLLVKASQIEDRNGLVKASYAEKEKADKVNAKKDKVLMGLIKKGYVEKEGKLYSTPKPKPVAGVTDKLLAHEGYNVGGVKFLDSDHLEKVFNEAGLKGGIDHFNGIFIGTGPAGALTPSQRQEAALRASKALGLRIQMGKLGGMFYVNANGNKVYVYK